MKLSILSAVLLLSLDSILVGGETVTAPHVKVEQAEKQIASGVQLVDVRTKEEWDEGHIKGAALASVKGEGFIEKAKSILDPKKEVLVYCRSGNRSAVAAKQLREAGFTVTELEGGMNAWSSAGKPVVK